MAMPDTSLRPHPVSAVTLRRETLTKDLQTKENQLRTLNGEMKSITGADRDRLLWMIQDQAAAVKQARANLERFESPIVLPQLSLDGLALKFKDNNKLFNATVWVKNTGILNAIGSFSVTVSVTFTSDYSQSPPLTSNLTFPMNASDSSDIQPGNRLPFTTGDIPFVPQPGISGARYTFDILLFAGPDGVVANQSLHQNVWVTLPLFEQPIPVGPLPVE